MKTSRSAILLVMLLTLGFSQWSGHQVYAQQITPSVVQDCVGGLDMSDEQVASFVERFDAVFNGPNLDVIDEIFAPDYVGHLPLTPDLNREGLKAYIASFYPAISNLRQETQNVILAQDRLVLQVTYSGTNDGALFGIPATNREVSMPGIGIFCFNDDGLVAENWALIDVAGLLAQIGAFPPAPAT